MEIEKIFLVALSGYISLSIYRYRTKSDYAELNTQKYFLHVLLFGLPSLLVSLVFLIFAEPAEPTEKTLSTLIVLSISCVVAVFFGYIMSEESTQERISFIKNEVINEGIPPRTNGLVEYDWFRFIEEQILLISLKNEKVYIAYLIFADFHDDLNSELRAIRVKPIKSGHRMNGKVEFDKFYISLTEEEKKTISNLEVEQDSFGDLLYDKISKIPDLVIFQREIVSYAVYDPALDFEFHGQSLTKPIAAETTI